MYLFVRRARLAGGQTRASMMWATEITERVNQVTDLGVTLHAQVFSPNVGELVWGTIVPDLAALETGFDKLMIDDFYVAEQDRAHGFLMEPPTDALERIVHGEPVDLGPGSYTSTITAVCLPGRLERGLTCAVELADRAMEVTGAPMVVTLHTTGSYGTISWLSGHPGIESLSAAQDALAADATWARFVDDHVGDVYCDIPEASLQAVYRRLS